MNKIDLRVEKEALPLDKALLRKIVRATLAAAGFNDVELSVYVCDPERMRGINAEWRGKDRPTDVLSFSQIEGPQEGFTGGMLGDLVLCSDVARAQATENGLRYEEELLRLVVHGIAHLAGFDHETGAADAKKMRAEEERVRKIVEAGFARKKSAQEKG